MRHGDVVPDSLRAVRRVEVIEHEARLVVPPVNDDRRQLEAEPVENGPCRYRREIRFADRANDAREDSCLHLHLGDASRKALGLREN